MKIRTSLTTILLSFFGLTSVASYAQSPWEMPRTPPPPHERQSSAVEKNLKTFDTLDFDVFSNQKWNRLHESHAKDITIKVHPIRFGSGSWTAVTGVMTGTFTKPMPTPDGKTIAPTGKRFALGMVTIGHWKGATMDHEWLVWDNQDFMNQIGLGK